MEQDKPRARVKVFTMSIEKFNSRSLHERQWYPLIRKWDKDRSLPPGCNFTGDYEEQRNYFYEYRD